jgi:NDP-sugar pyrophosphorylase family protein
MGRGGWIHPTASVSAGASLRAPFFVGPDCHIEAGATIGPNACLTEGVRAEAGSRVVESVLWAGSRLGKDAVAEGALLGTRVELGQAAFAGPGSVLGAGSRLTDFTRTS